MPCSWFRNGDNHVMIHQMRCTTWRYCLTNIATENLCGRFWPIVLLSSQIRAVLSYINFSRAETFDGEHCKVFCEVKISWPMEMYFILQIFKLKTCHILFSEIALNPCKQFCEATEDGSSVDVIQMDLENGARCYDNFSSFDVCIQGKCQVCYIKMVHPCFTCTDKRRYFDTARMRRFAATLC